MTYGISSSHRHSDPRRGVPTKIPGHAPRQRVADGGAAAKAAAPKTAAPKAAAPKTAARDDLAAFRFIQELGTQARALRAELDASPAHATIDEQSTSEDMNSQQFKLFSKSSKFSSHVLGKAFKYALAGGKRAPDPRLTAEEQGQLAGLEEQLGRALMRSKDSYLSAGERHLASTQVADVVIALQDFVNRKARDTALDEGKKALDGARGWFSRLLGGKEIGSPDSEPTVP